MSYQFSQKLKADLQPFYNTVAANYSQTRFPDIRNTFQKDYHTYSFTGDGSRTQWTINHGLNLLPIVQCYDDTNSLMIVDVEQIDLNSVRITFLDPPLNGWPFTVILMGATMLSQGMNQQVITGDGVQDTWMIINALNQFVYIAVYDSNNKRIFVDILNQSDAAFTIRFLDPPAAGEWFTVKYFANSPWLVYYKDLQIYSTAMQQGEPYTLSLTLPTFAEETWVDVILTNRIQNAGQVSKFIERLYLPSNTTPAGANPIDFSINFTNTNGGDCLLFTILREPVIDVTYYDAMTNTHGRILNPSNIVLKNPRNLISTIGHELIKIGVQTSPYIGMFINKARAYTDNRGLYELYHNIPITDLRITLETNDDLILDYCWEED